MSDKKLATKLLAILEHMDSVPKNGYNSHQKYHYMREVDVMEALKKELIKHKIIMLTSSKFVDIQKKEGNAKTEFVTTVETVHTFHDVETNEQFSINSVGSGYDSSDKGASKAITAAFKYAITKTFMISDEGADIENDGKTEQKPVKTTPKIGPAAIKAAPAKVETKVAEVKTEVAPPPVAETPVVAKVAEPKTTTNKVNFAKRPTLPSAAPKAEPKF